MTKETEDERERVVPVLEESGGDESIDREIEPGRPRPEHTLFVVLGMVLTVVVLLRGLGLL